VVVNLQQEQHVIAGAPSGGQGATTTTTNSNQGTSMAAQLAGQLNNKNRAIAAVGPAAPAPAPAAAQAGRNNVLTPQAILVATHLMAQGAAVAGMLQQAQAGQRQLHPAGMLQQMQVSTGLLCRSCEGVCKPYHLHTISM
jgi:hypothetical protein